MTARSEHPPFLLTGSYPTPSPRPDAARRVAKRRPTYFATAGSYTLDFVILALYAALGATSFGIAFAYLAYGLVTITIWLVLSEIGFNERFEDHYLTVPQTIVGIMPQLVGMLLAPEVGVYFLTVLFVVLGFAALRLTWRQTTYVYLFATLGLVVLLFVTGGDIRLPTDTSAERVVALAGIITALARCAMAGLYGSGLRTTLYKRSRELETARARIEELAYMDELTGAANRRDILRALDEQIARVGRGTGDCTLAIVDLDHFKRINDNHGHGAGDDVLRTFAIMAFANIRRTDKLGRYGGEEFLLVMPDTPYADAVHSVERLRRIVAELDWSDIAPSMEVTMSAGLARMTRADTAETILLRADAALYRAKEQGRNQTIAA